MLKKVTDRENEVKSMWTIKEILEHYRKITSMSVDELAEVIGLSRNALYVRYRQPGQWRLCELTNAYDFLKVPREERKYEENI